MSHGYRHSVKLSAIRSGYAWAGRLALFSFGLPTSSLHPTTAEPCVAWGPRPPPQSGADDAPEAAGAVAHERRCARAGRTCSALQLLVRPSGGGSPGPGPGPGGEWGTSLVLREGCVDASWLRHTPERFVAVLRHGSEVRSFDPPPRPPAHTHQPPPRGALQCWCEGLRRAACPDRASAAPHGALQFCTEPTHRASPLHRPPLPCSAPCPVTRAHSAAVDAAGPALRRGLGRAAERVYRPPDSGRPHLRPRARRRLGRRHRCPPPILPRTPLSLLALPPP